jgi:beta-glucosidase
VQEDLVRELAKTGKPIAMIVYAGRSLTLESMIPLVDSVLFSWHLGTMMGPALTDLALGVTAPSGKLPITFPRSVGHIPTYYNKKNTGRPNNTHEYQAFTSSYIDCDTTPLFSYGFGLSYTTFSYSNFKQSKTKLAIGETLLVSATVKNEGTVKADETVLLFVRDLVGSYTRPVKELKDFTRVTLNPGQSTTVSFVLTSNNLKFWTKDKEYKA